MNFGVLRYLTFIVLFFAAEATGFGENIFRSRGVLSKGHVETRRVAGFYTSTRHDHGPSINFLGFNGSLQICRAQNQRNFSAAKSLLTFAAKFNLSFRLFTTSFLSSAAEHLSSCKLILFPFHVFW